MLKEAVQTSYRRGGEEKVAETAEIPKTAPQTKPKSWRKAGKDLAKSS